MVLLNSNLAISKNFWTANTSYVTVYVGTMVYNAYECSLTINVGLKTSIAQYNSLVIGTTSVKPPLDIVTGLVTTNGIRYQLFITAGGNIQIQAMSGAIASGDSIAAHIKYFVA